MFVSQGPENVSHLVAHFVYVVVDVKTCEMGRKDRDGLT